MEGEHLDLVDQTLHSGQATDAIHHSPLLTLAAHAAAQRDHAVEHLHVDQDARGVGPGIEMSVTTGAISAPVRKPVALTGDRPTGPLHLGHYVGSLRSRIALQDEADQTILIADLQALTDRMQSFAQVRSDVLEVALDYLAVGIDPAKSTLCIQSGVPELAELSMLLLNLVSVARLERNPTVKEELRLRGFERDLPAGFLIYPVSQAADITAFRAELVPVGVDQVPMIEQTNELVRRLNDLVGRKVLVECRAVLSSAPRLPGIDGKHKMSKSLGNGIALGASPDAIHAAVQRMYTDPKHLRVADPGQTDGNVVFAFLDAFEPASAELEALKAHYRRGGVADRATKARLEDRLQALLGPIRERRAELAADPQRVLEILLEGTRHARKRAAATLADVRQALCLAGSTGLRRP